MVIFIFVIIAYLRLRPIQCPDQFICICGIKSYTLQGILGLSLNTNSIAYWFLGLESLYNKPMHTIELDMSYLYENVASTTLNL